MHTGTAWFWAPADKWNSVKYKSMTKIIPGEVIQPWPQSSYRQLCYIQLLLGMYHV